MTTQTNLYTHLRLDDFVNNFKQWFDSSTLSENSEYTGGDYKYIHYVPSPNGTHLIDIGRIPFVDVFNTYFNQVKSLSGQSNSINQNTPTGWQVQLGSDYTILKRNEEDYLKSKAKISPGLTYQLIKFLPKGSSTPGVQTFSDIGITNTFTITDYINKHLLLDKFPQKYETLENNANLLASGSSSKMDYNDVLLKAENNIREIKTNYIAIEWFGYFKPPTIGNYSFSIKVGSNDFCLLWLGNKAICEYSVKNADITNNLPFQQTIPNYGYYPIRVQYYSSVSLNDSNRSFSLDIKNTTTGSIVDKESCLVTIDDGEYFPTFVYCAFTSSSIDDYKLGKFNCYTTESAFINKTTRNAFYAYLKKEKHNIYSGAYDYETRAGGKILQYGTLLSGINYTDGSSPNTLTPETLSVYRLYSDIRLGRTFQLNSDDDKTYTMLELSNDLITLGNNYTAFPDYYPTQEDTTVQNTKQVNTVNECEDTCNSSENCKYYYTYTSTDTTSDKKQYCVFGINNNNPAFNQIAGSNQINGSLHIRENKLSKPTVQECIHYKMYGKQSSPAPTARLNETYSSIINTTLYDKSNPYSNYTISGDVISTIADIGVCTDETVLNDLNRYNVAQDIAKNILFKKNDYNEDGKYKDPTGKFITPNYGKNDISWWTDRKNVDGFTTTTAVDDTQSNIQNLEFVQRKVKKQNEKIQANFLDLSQNLIPAFMSQREVLNKDIKFDYSGNVLLYLKDQKIPSIEEQHVIDTSDDNFKQNSMYVLSAITVTTLIVLALLLGRD